jgi:integrase
VTKLTETTAATLAPGKILRDSRFKGLIALGRKGSTTWAYQTDLRRNGRFVRTVRVTLGKQGDMDLKAARIAAAKAQEQIRAGVDPNSEAKSAKDLNMLSVLEDHLKERSLAARTEWDYNRHWTSKSLDTLYPLRNMHPRDITRDDVRTLKARLMKRGSTMCGGALRVLRLTLTHAMRMDERVKENPCQFVVIPSTPKRQTGAVDLKEFAERVVQLPLMWRALWTTCLLTGARRASVLAMRRKDVSVANRTIRLTHVKTMKQGAILPIGPKLAELLGRYLEEPSASEWIWPGRVGKKPLANLRLRGWPYGAHQLRHNYTTLATKAAVPFMEQRMLMTHAVPGIAQVYTHPETLVEHLRQYAEAIERLVATEAPSSF